MTQQVRFRNKCISGLFRTGVVAEVLTIYIIDTAIQYRYQHSDRPETPVGVSNLFSGAIMVLPGIEHVDLDFQEIELYTFSFDLVIFPGYTDQTFILVCL